MVTCLCGKKSRFAALHAFLMEMGRRANKGQEKRAFAAVGKTGCIASIGFRHPHPHLVPGVDDHGGECLFVNYRDCESGY